MKIEHYKDSICEYWYYLDEKGNTLCHRGNDLPAFIYPNGDKFWYQHGKYHRETGAAEEYANGYLGYWYNGEYLGNSSEGYTKKQFEQYKKLIVFL